MDNNTHMPWVVRVCHSERCSPVVNGCHQETISYDGTACYPEGRNPERKQVVKKA